MNTPFTKKGYWYLPTKLDHKVAGILTFVPGERVRLDLFGNITGSSHIDYFKLVESNNRDVLPIIYGYTSDSKHYTLLDCIIGQSSLNFSSEFPLTSLIIQTVFEGNILDDIYLSNFKSIKAELSQLQEWLWMPGIQPTDSSSYDSFTLAYQLPKGISFSIGEGFDITFSFKYERSYPDPFNCNIAQYSFIEITGFSYKRRQGSVNHTFVVTRLQNHDYSSLPR